MILKWHSAKVDSAGTEEGKRILQMIADKKISSEEGQHLLIALSEKETQKAGSQPTPIALKIVSGIVVLEIAIMVASAIIALFESIVSTNLLEGLSIIIGGSLIALCLQICRNFMTNKIVSPESPYASLSINMRQFYSADWLVRILAIVSTFAVVLITALRGKGLM